MTEADGGKPSDVETLLQQAFRALSLHIDQELERELAGMRSLLDVGCGPSSSIPVSGKRESVGVDSFLPSLVTSRQREEHVHCVLADASSLPFKSNSFDCALAVSVIEHLPKEEGLRLLNEVERVSRRKCILITPNGFLPQRAYGGNPLQAHLSGWTVQEFRDLGYEVIGVGGIAGLKGERGICKLSPRIFWRLVSGATQPLIRKRPEKAFELLSIKRLSRNR